MSYYKNRRFPEDNQYYSEEDDNDFEYEEDYDYKPKGRDSQDQYVPDYSDDEYEDSDILDEQLGYNLQDKKEHNNNNKQQIMKRDAKNYTDNKNVNQRNTYVNNNYNKDKWNYKRFERRKQGKYYDNKREDNDYSNQKTGKKERRNNYNDYEYYKGREQKDYYIKYEKRYKGGKEYKTYNEVDKTEKDHCYNKKERQPVSSYNKRGEPFSKKHRKDNYQEREIEITDNTPLEVHPNNQIGPIIKINTNQTEKSLSNKIEELNIDAAEFYPKNFKK